MLYPAYSQLTIPGGNTRIELFCVVDQFTQKHPYGETYCQEVIQDVLEHTCRYEISGRTVTKEHLCAVLEECGEDSNFVFEQLENNLTF